MPLETYLSNLQPCLPYNIQISTQGDKLVPFSDESFNFLTPTMIESLNTPLIDEEIEATVKYLSLWKAPGSDDVPPAFLSTQLGFGMC